MKSTDPGPDDLSVVKLARAMWAIGLLGGIFNVWNSMECTVFTPYLYTRVQCCGSFGALPSTFDITHPNKIKAIQKEAARLHLGTVPVEHDAQGAAFIPACSVPVFPEDSRLWSTSRECVNVDYVRSRAQHLVGITNPLQSVATLVVLPVGGIIADRCGRIPVLYVYALMCTLACALFVIDAKFFSAIGDVCVIVGAMMICPCWEPKETVLNGTVADIFGRTSANANRGINLLNGFIAGGWIVGFLIMYIVLGLNLNTYFFPWIAFTAVAFSLIIILRLAVTETLPQKLRGSLKLYMFNPLQAQFGNLNLMRQDTFLVLLMVNGVLIYVHFVGFITLLFSTLQGMGFSMREAMLPNLVMGITEFVFLMWAAENSHKIGAMNLYVLGNVAFILGYLFYGPILLALGHPAPYIGSAFIGIGLSCFGPAMAVIIARRVGEAHQVKCQAAAAWVFKIGCIIGPPIWNQRIYDATAEGGFAVIRPAFVSLLLSLVTTIIALYMRAKEDVFAVAPEAQDLPDERSKLPLHMDNYSIEKAH